MEKVKKWFFCLLCVLGMASISRTARAAEILEDPSAMITFMAHVPEGFDEDIILKIKNLETDVTVTLILADSVEYTRSVMLLRNSPVSIEPIIRAGGYVTDFQDSYSFAAEDTVEFHVTEDTGEQQKLPGSESQGETTEAEVPHREETDIEIDELTGLESAESVWDRFVTTCAAMEGDPAVDHYYSLASAQLIKQSYLKDKETNTEEAWDAMTNLERYVLYQAYTCPKNELMRGADNEEDFLEELMETDKALLKDVEGGDVILEALEDLWRWHYKYYLHTGTFYDFYADYDGEYVGTPLDGSGSAADVQSVIDEIKEELSDSEIQEIQEALEEENPHGEETGNGLTAWIRNHVITLGILVAVGIALVVVTVMVRRKNIQQTD